MCGILYCQLDGQSIEQLQDRWKLIAHRGPDGGRCLVAHGAFWGFRRLSIVNLDVEAAMQPIEQNGSVLMCNGEIYNHTALRSGEHQTDVAVITEVLDGVAMASHADICERIGRLDGDFALVYASADGQLLLTRDPVGVKPLYYAVDSAGRLVAAASEVKCMVGLPRVDKIHHVPPGSYIRGDDAQVRRYTEWRTKEGTNKADIPRVFREAVRKRLHHGDQPVALLCSGGLDSSVIVELAKTLVKDPRDLHAFSVQFEEGESLDTRYATDLLKELCIQHTVVTFTWAQVQECLCDVVTTCETNDMFSIVAAVPLYLLAKHIRENTHYRVILSGEGADEIFCGYQYFTLSPNDAATEAESQRLLDNIHGFDLLRTERCFSRHGLEIRVPYLDPALVKLVLNIPGFWRRPQGQREKGLLRDSFPLPALKRTGVLERLKMRLSDGCSFGYWGRIDAEALELRCKQLFAERFGDQTEWLLERAMPIWADKPRARSGGSSMSIQSTLRTL